MKSALLLVWVVAVAFGVGWGWLLARSRRSRWPTLRIGDFGAPDELFQCLLSGNVAWLEQDDFTSQASGHPRKKVLQLLRQHLGVTNRAECLVMLDQRLLRLGTGSAVERAAFAAWARGATLESEAFDALQRVLRFIVDQKLVPRERLGADHLCMLASDIQHAAYLARLALAAAMISADECDEVLGQLQSAARARYVSWTDYSLSALIGMGMRNGADDFHPGEWRRMADSHRAFAAADAAGLSRRAPWKPEPDGVATDAPRSREQLPKAGRRVPQPG